MGDCPHTSYTMLRIQGAVILVLSVLVAVNGLDCYNSCTGKDVLGNSCPASVSATDTVSVCPAGTAACVKQSWSTGSAKQCGSTGVCDTLTAAAKGLDVKDYKCYECTGNLCNSATGLHAGAWTAVLASVVALVNAHY